MSCSPIGRVMKPYVVNGVLVTGDGQWVWFESGDLAGCRIKIVASLGEDVERMQMCLSPVRDPPINTDGVYLLDVENRDKQWIADFRTYIQGNIDIQHHWWPCP